MAWESYSLLGIAAVVSIFRLDDTLILPVFFTIVTISTLYFYTATVIDMARILNVPILGMKKAASVKITPAKVIATKDELKVVSGEKAALRSRNGVTTH